MTRAAWRTAWVEAYAPYVRHGSLSRKTNWGSQPQQRRAMAPAFTYCPFSITEDIFIFSPSIQENGAVSKPRFAATVITDYLATIVLQLQRDCLDRAILP
jgi:hypothetical protein